MKLHLLPILAVTAWTGSLFNATPVSASAAVPSPTVSGQDIYNGALQNNWQYLGWGSAALTNTTPALSSHSIKAQEGVGQAVYLYHSKLHTTPATTFTFWVNGGATGGQSLVVKALCSGHTQTPVVLNALQPNTWQCVQIALPRLGVGSVSDLDGFWIQNNTAKPLAAFYIDKISLTAALAAPPPAAPATPTGLTATPQWAASCPVCGGMAMAHIAVTCSTVSGATAYTVYRNGVKQSSQATPGWTDMSVTSGQTYAYAVTATGPGGESPLSASVSATAPQPPMTAVLTAPVNLSIQGLWQGTATDMLTWSPVPGAASYNVYQYGVLIGSSMTPAFSVPPGVYNSGLTYTATAVDASGMESIPSAQAGAQQTFTTANVPGWVSTSPPSVPTSPVATPEWNNGKPRIHLVWQGDGSIQTFNVYRDGVAVAKGLWVLSYQDQNVQPGESHTYTVSGVNTYCPGTIEGAQSISATATALTAAPAKLLGKVMITQVIPNDDSCVVFFNEVPGAADYRIYDIKNPGKVKYAGARVCKLDNLGGPYTFIPFSIEWNGMDPAQGADLVVEAVDKLGPFQAMDGPSAMGTGTGMDGMGTMPEAINGQGDPSNIPNVLASSDSFHAGCTPRGPGRDMTGSPVFFDNFQTEQPFTLLPLPALYPGSDYGLPGSYKEESNDKWIIKHFGTDLVHSQTFVMNNHLMDIAYDGGGPGSSAPAHNNNASLVFQPKAVADISGGKVLHVTFEVDAHFEGRRWVNLFVGPADDTLLNPGKFDESDGGNNRATASGQMVRWEIQQSHSLTLYNNGQKTDLIQPSDWNDGNSLARVGYTGASLANGTTQDLDKRHRFDLYLSQTHYRIVETSPDGMYNISRDKDFPAGTVLPFTRCQIYLVHEIYHTSNDRPEQESFYPYNSYWYNNRPWADERHWDNIGEETLDAFPPLTVH